MVGKLTDLALFDQGFLGDLNETEFPGDTDVGPHALAAEVDFTAALKSEIDDLLNPGDVGGEDRRDDSSFGRAEDPLERHPHISFAQGESVLFGVCGIGEQGKDALASVMGKPGKVGHDSIHRGVVHLEIARVDQDAFGCVDGKPHTVHDAVVHPDQLDFKGVERDRFAGHNGMELRRLVQPVLPQFFPKELNREGGSVDRSVKFAKKKGHGTDVILVAMGQENGAKPVAVFPKVAEVRDHHVHPQHVFLGEHEAGVHHNQGILALQGHHVQTDFPQPSQGDHLEHAFASFPARRAPFRDIRSCRNRFLIATIPRRFALNEMIGRHGVSCAPRSPLRVGMIPDPRGRVRGAIQEQWRAFFKIYRTLYLYSTSVNRESSGPSPSGEST